MSTFEPVAIVGRACVLPGALSPEQFWQNILSGKDCLTHATFEDWRLDPQRVINNTRASLLPEQAWSDRFGFVKAFVNAFDPQGFFIAPEIVLQQDPFCQWLLYTCREALHDARYTLPNLPAVRSGVIVGNLSYPTASLSRYAESLWLLQQGREVLGDARYQQLLNEQPDPSQRFMSGMPMHLLAKALGLNGDAFAIDAACASALYAIKLACDRLHDGEADIMLAGGVNGADSLFLNMGFSALQALSKTGQSRPLHRHADGLIPAHGAAIVVLKRLRDAVAANDDILGVIRGIGLSNDGNNGGFLVPAEKGQVTAMQQAYAMAELDPALVSWVECHATGTSVGDATEIRSMQQVFARQNPLTMGAIKANIGHTITASGGAALIHVLSALKAKIKPATLHAPDDPSDALRHSSFALLHRAESWDPIQARRIAAINCFGFGGNNAHLIVEEWQPEISHSVPVSGLKKQHDDIAIVSVGIIAASAQSRDEFVNTVLQGHSLIRESAERGAGGWIDNLELDAKQIRFPPSDLQHTLGQQLAILKAGQDALATVQQIDPNRTAALIGMQCDAEITRWGLRWRLATYFPEADSQWLMQAQDAVMPALQAADIVGTLPNVVANRFNAQFDFKGPSFSISSEELSGITALQMGIRSLQAQEVDAVVVGAVDICCEMIQQTALNALWKNNPPLPGDAAVVLVLKRLCDAQQHGDKIYSVIPASTSQLQQPEWYLENRGSVIHDYVGYSQASSGLLHVAVGILLCQTQTTTSRVAKIVTHALSDRTATVFLREYNSRGNF